MTYFFVGLIYLVLLSFLIRFFQVVHRWDEEIVKMREKEDATNARTEDVKAA